MKGRRLTLTVLPVILLLAGCMQPLNETVTEQALDTTAPTVSVASPSDGAAYPSVVVVTGSVEDLTDSGAIGEVRRVRYRFSPDILPPGEASLDDGIFTFSFETGDFSGNISVELSAEDWNGNSATTSFVLVEGNPIPTFSVEPTATGFSATWEDLPLTDSYDLLYATGGLTPSEGQPWTTTVTDVSSGDAVSGLEPGTIVSVVLKANSSVEDSVSTPELVIPQNEYTFTPMVTGSSTRTVSWPEAVGWELFEVERSSLPDAGFVSISGQVSSTEFTDSSGASGISYYRVRPALSNAESSVSVASGQVLVPRSASVTLSVLGIPGGARDVVTSDSRAIVGEEANPNSTLRLFDISNPSSPSELGDLETRVPYAELTMSNTLFAYTNEVDQSPFFFDPYVYLLVGTHEQFQSFGIQDWEPLPAPGRVTDIAAEGTTVIVSTEEDGSGTDGGAFEFEVDVSNPTTPDIPLNSSAFDIDTGSEYGYALVENGYGYVLDQSEGATLTDYAYLLGSESPTEIAGLKGTDPFGDFSFRRPDSLVESSSERLVAAVLPFDIGETTQMSSYDVSSDPTAPSLEQGTIFHTLTDYSSRLRPESLAVGADSAYLVLANTDLSGDPLLRTIDRFDFRNPAEPRLVARLRPLSDAPSQIAVNDAATSREILLVISEQADTLEILDVGNLPWFADPATVNTSGADAMVSIGNIVIAVAGSGTGRTVRTVDLNTGATLETLSAEGGTASAVASHGDLIAVVGSDEVITLLMLDRATGTLTSLGTLSGTHQNVAFRGDALYTLRGGAGVARYRIALETPVDQWTPLETVTSSNAQDLIFTERHAYLADGGGGVRTFRLGPGGGLQPQSTTFLLGGASMVRPSANRLVVVSQNRDGLRSLSITDADNPDPAAEDSEFALPIPASGSDGITDLEHWGSLVYAAIDGYGLVLVDFGTPSRPTWIAGLARSSSERIGSIAIQGEDVLFATGAAILRSRLE